MLVLESMEANRSRNLAQISAIILFDIKYFWFPSAGRGVHSRAQSARALPGVLMAQVSTLRVEIFQECTLFLRVLQESAHFF